MLAKYVDVLVQYVELPPKQIGGSSKIHINWWYWWYIKLELNEIDCSIDYAVVVQNIKKKKQVHALVHYISYAAISAVKALSELLKYIFLSLILLSRDWFLWQI